MKHAISLLAFAFLCTFGAHAQSAQLLPLFPLSAAGSTVAPEASNSFESVALASAEKLPGSVATPGAAAAAPQEGRVINVRQSYSFQGYIGYTFVRSYASSALDANRNGANVSMSYFYKKGLFGVEGAVTAAVGSAANQTADFGFFGGGPRVRRSLPRGFQAWAHGLVGDARFSHQFAKFTQNGFAYEVGGGVDISSQFGRFRYRVEGDMIGSRLYGMTQYSPQISAGMVFEF